MVRTMWIGILCSFRCGGGLMVLIVCFATLVKIVTSLRRLLLPFSCLVVSILWSHVYSSRSPSPSSPNMLARFILRLVRTPAIWSSLNIALVSEFIFCPNVLSSSFLFGSYIFYARPSSHILLMPFHLQLCWCLRSTRVLKII